MKPDFYIVYFKVYNILTLPNNLEILTYTYIEDGVLSPRVYVGEYFIYTYDMLLKHIFKNYYDIRTYYFENNYIGPDKLRLSMLRNNVIWINTKQFDVECFCDPN